MQEYEVLIETINPCGGEAHANKEFREIETDSRRLMSANRAATPFSIPAKTPRATPSSPPATARAS